jgi:hypothetical protein
VSSPPPEWTLDDFDTWLARWRQSSKPGIDLALLVIDWVVTRAADPYDGAESQPDQPDLWYAEIPGSEDECGNVVTCAYWVNRETRTVTCYMIMPLR